MTKNEAINDLYTHSTMELAERVCESHKDFYGIKARNAYYWTKEELVGWWKSHFEWDEFGDCWRNIVEFC